MPVNLAETIEIQASILWLVHLQRLSKLWLVEDFKNLEK